MADLKQDPGLRTIFSFFLGLILTAFVGVAVYTFHPPPDQFDRQLRDLSRREATLRGSRSTEALTPAERGELDGIDRQRRDLFESAAEARKPWTRSTSVILIVFATLLMAVSLARAEQMPAINDGLLLGGLFTMLYGVGWIVTADSSVSRFLVMTGALAVTLILGYIRFARRSAVPPVGESARLTHAGTEDIERRIRELELRVTAAAQALGRAGDSATL